MISGRLEPSFLYDAFISYSWAKDRPLVAKLRKVLQSLGKPWWRRRALRVFLDDSSLSATPELWPAIERAMAQSRYMILFASPEAARSKWVEKEVGYWLEKKSANTLLIALSSGELIWDATAGDFLWTEATPLPPSLRGSFASEPKWIDLRPFSDAGDVNRDDHFLSAAADFAATISGTPKEDLLSEEVRQQKRAVRLAYGAAATLGVLAVAAAGLGYLAKQQSDVAAEQRDIAVVERNRAEDNEQKAVEALDNARRNISIFRAERAEALIRENQMSTAMLLALEGLPDQTAQSEERRQWPVTPQAQAVLEKTLREGREALTIFAHDRDVYGLRFSADGKRILSSSWDGIKLWDAERGSKIATLEGTGLQSIAEFSPDGTVILTGENAAIVNGEQMPAGGLLWDGVTGARRGEIRFPANLQYFAPFNPEMAVLQFNRAGTAGIYFDGHQIDIWRGDLWRGKLELVKRRKLKIPGASQFDFAKIRIALDQAGTLGVTVHGRKAQVWNMETGERRAELGPISGGIESVHIDEVNNRIVIADRAGAVQVWDLKSGAIQSRARIERHQIFDTADAATNAEFSKSGTHLLIAVDKGSTQLIDMRTGQAKLLEPTNATFIAFSDDSKFLVAATSEQAVVSDVATGQTLFVFGSAKSGIISVAFSPDSRLLATGTESGEINIWSLRTKVASGETVAPKDCRRQIWLDDPNLVIWPSGGEARSDDSRIAAAVLESLGKEISPADEKRDLLNWRAPRLVQVAINAPKELIAIPDGEHVANVALTQDISIWDMETGKRVHTIKTPHSGLVGGLHFSPDGRFLLTYGQDRVATIWDMDDFSVYSTLPHAEGANRALLIKENVVNFNTDSVWSGCFSSDGMVVATASGDGVRIWDVQKKEQIRHIEIDFEPSFLDFSEDMLNVIVGSRQNEEGQEKVVATAFSLSVDVQRLVEQAKMNAPSCLTRVQREQLLLAPEPPDWCIEMSKPPYNSSAWQAWLKAHRAGENVPLPN